MNWLSFHVASGASLFSGALFLTLGVVLAGKTKGRIKFLCKLGGSLGGALIVLSSTPFPFWLYAGFVVFVFVWLIAESVPRLQSGRPALVCRVLLIGSTLTLVLIEIPHRRLPRLPNVRHGQLYVIGDSISAGIDQDPNWGEVFRKEYGLNIQNLAKPDA